MEQTWARGTLNIKRGTTNSPKAPLGKWGVDKEKGRSYLKKSMHFCTARIDGGCGRLPGATDFKLKADEKKKKQGKKNAKREIRVRPTGTFNLQLSSPGGNSS